MNINALHERFCEEALVIKNYSPETIKWYQRTIYAFLKYHPEIESIEQITTERLRRFLYWGRLERQWTADTFMVYYKGLKSFLKWSTNRSYIDVNPILVIEKPKMEKKLPKRITKNEALLVLEYAFNQPSAYQFQRFRDRAVFGVMIYAGLRSKEVLQLKVHDVDLENGLIHVINGKGGKDRVVPVCTALKSILEDYWRDRTRLKKETIYYFSRLRGEGPFTKNGLKKIVERIRTKSGVNFSPHKLRHTFATMMLEGGCDVFTLSKMLGHSDIKTTTIYLSASVNHMREQILKHPLN